LDDCAAQKWAARFNSVLIVWFRQWAAREEFQRGDRQVVCQAFPNSCTEGRTLYHGRAYTGNPLAAAVALATLDVFDEEQTLAHLPPKIDRLAEHLARIAAHPRVGDVRQRGLMAGIELVQDRQTREPYAWAEKRGYRVCDAARAEGVWLRPLGNVVVLMPPLAIALNELDRICLAVEHGIVQATAR